MVSMLEDLLLRYNNGKAQLRVRLLMCLDDRSLRTLRLASRVLHDLVDHYANRMFTNLFVLALRLDHTNLDSFRKVAPFCQTLVIKVGLRTRDEEARPRRLLEKKRLPSNIHGIGISKVRQPARERWHRLRQALPISTSSSSSSPSIPMSSNRVSAAASGTQQSSWPDSSNEASHPSVQFLWTSIFSRCQQVREISIKTTGEPGWPGRTEVEDTLVQLRVALESVQLPNVRSIRLAPIHAMGIVHLRWSGLGVFGVVSTSGNQLWRHLHTLDLQIQNPFLTKHKLSESQQIMFKKVLHDYLRSFSGTLKCLRFVWMEDDGPSPFTLDLEPGLEGHRQPVLWSALDEVCLGNIALPHRTIRRLPERVTRAGIRLKMLRSTHRHSRAVFDNVEAWVEVLLDFAPHGIEREKVFSQASSVYSQ